MDSIQIDGGIPLQGQVKIQGSKNATLPILAAAILVRGKSLIENCPKISDVFHMQALLTSLGCKVIWEGSSLRIDASDVRETRMPYKEVTAMRSSISLLGALLARNGEAVLYHPGGCVIGARPIDIHLETLSKLGVHFEEKEEADSIGLLYACTSGLEGATVRLRFPSVGATQNLLLAAVLAKGDTYIENAAREPEVASLCEFLQRAGANITGIGSTCIHIKGVEQLYESCYRIPADRIVAGTYLTGCMLAGGSVLLKEAPVKQMQAVLETADRMGAFLQEAPEGLFVQSPKRLQTPGHIDTAVYPGFPTDMQSFFLVALTGAQKESVLTETIFENRFHIAAQLTKMGARLKVDGNHVYIRGNDCLIGTTVQAEELRGGAALVMAGLAATGHTRVEGCSYIYRGYENIGRDLRELGARVYSV